MSIEAMKQALEALEHIQRCIGLGTATIHYGSSTWEQSDQAITTLRAAIEHAERPMTHSADCWRWHHACARAWIERNKPAAPRQWQGLTDEEIQAAWASMNHDPAAFVHFAGGALWAEAKCKEKNG